MSGGGQTVEITGGTGTGQIRKIIGTNPFQVFIDPAWQTITDDTSQYAIYPRSQPGIAEVFLTTSVYDTLDRLQLKTDNFGQTLYYRYDSRNNLVAEADAQGPSSGTTTRRVFSNGPLTVNDINDFGNVTLYYYDGINRETRKEVVLTATGSGDGVRIGASIEGIKNEADVSESFVPASDMTKAGGDGLIRIGTVYDDNSLVSAQLDDQGNVTLSLYDNLNRSVTKTKGLTIGTSLFTKALILGSRNIVTPEAVMINEPSVISTDKINTQLVDAKARLDRVASLFPSLADQIDDNPPTTVVYGYDADSNLLIVEDENDTEVFTRYDALNRLIAVRVFRAGQDDNHGDDPLFAPTPVSDPPTPSADFPSVVGTTRQNYQYDGLSRLVMASDDNNPIVDADDSTVSYAFDSLSRVIEERQQNGSLMPETVSASWRANNLRSALTFPNGRVIEYRYDGLDRINTIAGSNEMQSLVDYDYIGVYRVLERRYPMNGTRMTYLDDNGTTDVGYDAERRQAQLRHLRGDNSLVAGFSHTYDRMNNKLTEEKLHSPADSELYRYDSPYRLVQFERGILNTSKDTIDVPSARLPGHSTWEVDGAGNWTSVGSETREHSSFNEIISQSVEGTLVTLAYDNAGNLTDDGTSTVSTFEWDFNNRLHRVKRKSDGQIIADYSYDATGRRTGKTVINSGPLDGTTAYYYDGQRVIEEQDGIERLSQQYVYGDYIDEVLVMDRNLDADSTATGPGDQRLFYHQNSLMSPYALTDRTAALIEGYLYDAYGQLTVYKPGNNGLVDFGNDDDIAANGKSDVSNPYLFTGRRLDSETGLLYFRARYFDPNLGRFISRDPIGCWRNRNNLGNGYAYTANNPVNYRDPFGLDYIQFQCHKVCVTTWKTRPARDRGGNIIGEEVLSESVKCTVSCYVVGIVYEFGWWGDVFVLPAPEVEDVEFIFPGMPGEDACNACRRKARKKAEKVREEVWQDCTGFNWNRMTREDCYKKSIREKQRKYLDESMRCSKTECIKGPYNEFPLRNVHRN